MTKYYQLRRTFSLAVLFTLFSVAAFAQKMITGTVTSAEDNEPIPGANVLIKGTASGTITDFNGAFQLEASNQDVLVVSFVGYSPTEIPVGTQTRIDVKLATDVTNLEEVVVIGYGSVKKQDATGSVQAITAEDLNKGAITSPQDLIVGKTAGVQITTAGGAPGAGATIRIRGGASMSASNDPLIVVDGVPVASDGINGMANPLATINPNDIESFTILKDASATAIYGSRASNGVIIITTKTGKGSNRVKVDYSANASVGVTSNRIEVYGADEYRGLVNKLYGVDNPVIENNPSAIAALGEANTNWQDEIYRPAFGTDHNVSISGGIEALPYRLSVGYSNQNGVLETSNIERVSLGLNLNPTFLDDHLKVNLSTKGTFVKNQFANEGAIGAALGFDPTQPVYSGTDQWGGYWQWLDNGGNPKAFTPTNPVSMLNQVDDRSDVNRFIGNLGLDYKLHFLPDLSVNMNIGVDIAKSRGEKWTSRDASFAYIGANSDDESPAFFGEQYIYSQDKSNTVFDLFAKYDKEVGKHRFDIMGGYSWQHFLNEGHNFKNDFDNARPVPLQDLPFAGENYLVSFYGRFNYTFADKYLLTGTVRQDGTSRFNADNRWGTFPSVAAGWKIHEEAFLKSSNFVNELKLRAGWGITGQQDISGNDYVGYATYTLSDNGARYVFGDRWFNTYRPNGLDPNLKWEETTNINMGIDFVLMEQRLRGSFDVYHRTTNDLINTITVAAGTNLSDRIVSNIGSLVNQGFEVNLLGIPVMTDDFYWEVGANLTYNQNEITQLTAVDDPSYAGVPTGEIGDGRFIQMNSVGRSVNAFYVYEQVYDQAGNPLEGVYVDQNGDGIINSEDLVHYGSSVPNYLIGLNTKVSYKNWDLSLSGRLQLGAQIYNQVAQGSQNWNMVYNPTTQALSNKMANSGDTQFLYTDNQRAFSSHWIENADFFRMDNITIGYNFDSFFGMEKTNMRVYATGQNLFVISN
ncbi:TonB-dependent receptor [Persicobacter sp. CCB-QB2]|uniref:SusC/RagA family TonB-linked outer membrane protein n=1 Tax=Persicobacter sp. CCB-QB2 TaxID=1561025 RepID=UPI0009E3C477|nr:TonB-dependent receptor [Persicobacter sp. CCB-QB2]